MSVNEPKVSVIIPTLNRSSTILAAIYSVLGQSYKNLEVIVVDDGSVDDTEQRVCSISDTRLKYLKYAESRGAPTARNSGIRACSAEIVAFCDSDDIWHPEKLNRMYDVLYQESRLVGACSSSICFDGGSVTWVPDFLCDEIGYLRKAELFERNFVSTSTLIVSKSALNNVGGFDEDLPRFQDWDLVLRLLSVGSIAIVREPLVVRRISSDSISVKPALYLTAMEHFYKKHYAEIRNDSGAYALWLLRVGYVKVKTGRLVSGVIQMIHAVLRNPLQIGALFRWFRNL